MKRIVFILICACFVQCLLAGTPRLSRSQLKQVSMVKDQTVKISTDAGREKSPTLQQVLMERNLTLDDNKINGKAPSRQSLISMTGLRIASIEACDFDWDNENAVAILNDTSIMGKLCTIEIGSSIIDNPFFLTDFFGSYNIPLKLNFFSNSVSIQAGVVLDFMTNEDDNGVYQDSLIIWRLYAMPVSWLTGETDDYEDINGVVHDDGSVEFTDGFGFLVEKEVIDDSDGQSVTTWGLSPIFKNLILFKPNATHRFSYVSDDTGGLNPGGGLDPGSVAYVNQSNSPYDDGTHGFTPHPVNPRPGSSGNNSSSSSATTKDPGSTKPVNPRQFTPAKAALNHNSANLGLDKERNTTDGSENPTLTVNGTMSWGYTSVYLYMLNDTTLMVYNLYDKDYCWNFMKISPDGTVDIPAQPMASDNNGVPLYNCSKFHDQPDTLMWGNRGEYDDDQISWSSTYLCSATGTEGQLSVKKIYSNNHIYFGVSFNIMFLPSSPENLSVNPDVNTAFVAWEDSVSTTWNLRYRQGSPYGEPYYCDFEDTSGWVAFDNDGDGWTWHPFTSSDDNQCLASDSWDWGDGSLTPDNWLISPVVDLYGIVRFRAWGQQQDYADENFAVYVTTNPDFEAIDEFELISDEIITANPLDEVGSTNMYVFDLSAYAGQQGCIAIRHYDVTEMSSLCVDDFFVGDPDALVYEWIYLTDLEDTNCVIEGLAPETIYEVEVQAVDEYGWASRWTQPEYFTTLNEPIGLRGDVDDNGIINISDVSTLISRLLSNDWDSDPGQFNYDNADCDLNDIVTISDVTTLISFLLLQSW